MKKHILLVEDEEFVAKAYDKHFRVQGYSVDIAKNTLTAKKLIHKHIPDIILLDIILPGENGLRLLERLKGDIKTKTIPVIVISNLSNPHEIEWCKKMGVLEYMVKTDFSVQQVINKVSTYIQ